MELEDEQYELLGKFVEAHLGTPRERRGAFTAIRPRGQWETTFFHSGEPRLSFQGSMSDAEMLADAGLLLKSVGPDGSVSFSVLHRGIDAYRKGRDSFTPLHAVPLGESMYVSVAVKLTPETEEQLLKLEEQGALDGGTTRILRDLLTLRKHSSKPSISEIARQSDLSAQTVKRLERLEGGLATSANSDAFASAFLIYGGPDEAFARKLYENLSARGVTVFFFPESATPGKRLHRTMSEGIHEYDRTLLLCSRNSLTRPGVLNELEQILAREAREGGAELLIPVLLDDFALLEWSPERPDLARQIRDRVASDFRNSESEDEFIKQFERLIKALSLPMTVRAANTGLNRTDPAPSRGPAG